MQTEEELLAILEEHLPEDLTAEQVEALHAGVQGSLRLREAILESLGLEHAVAASYAPEPLDVGELIRRYRDRARQQRRARWRSVAWFVLAIVAASAVSLGVWAIVQHWGSESTRLAERPPAADHRELAPQSQPIDANTDTDRDREGVNPGEEPDPPTDATPPTAGGPVVEPSEPLPDFEPAWRLYDDRALRGDRTWQTALHKVLLPVGASVIARGGDDEGRFELDGTFVAMRPNPDGRRVRLAFSGLDRMQWYFWQENGTDGVLIRWHAPTQSLRAFSIHRDVVPRQTPRFASEATGLQWLRGDGVTGTNRNIDFTWDSQDLPLKEIGSGRILSRWRGFVRFPGGGRWKFAVTTKGMVSVFLDGERVLYRQASSTPETSVANVPYVGSYYERENSKPIVRNIEIRYLGRPQDDGLRLEWERSASDVSDPVRRRDAIARHVVPAEAFVAGDAEQGAPGGLAATHHFSLRDGFIGPIQVGHLIATDNGAWRRCFGGGSLDVLYASGAIRLVRGDSELLAAAMDPPDRFVMDTRCTLRNAEVLRLAPMRDFGDLAGCSVATSVHPLDANQWIEGREFAAPGIEVRSVDDDLEFSRRDSLESHAALLAVEGDAGCELTARIDEATTGTGILLRHPAVGRSDLGLTVGEHRGRRVLYTTSRGRGYIQDYFDRGWFVADRFWIRCAVGLNHVRMEFSNDGMSWIAADRGHMSSVTDPKQPFHIGVRVAEGGGARLLRLGELQVRRLHGLEDLADERAFSLACKNLESIEDWRASFQAILDAPIDGVTRAQWAVACHLAALYQGGPVSERERSVIEFLRAATRANVPWERLRPALVELPRRVSFDDYGFSPRDLAELYQDIARRLWNSGRRDELTALANAWYGQHWRPTYSREMSRLPAPLARFSLFGMAIESDWENLFAGALRAGPTLAAGRRIAICW